MNDAFGFGDGFNTLGNSCDEWACKLDRDCTRGGQYAKELKTFRQLLAGRYLDQSMRRKMRAVAGNLAALKAETATKFVGSDKISVVPIAAVQAGDIVLLRPGERSAVDSCVTRDSPRSTRA